MVNITGGGESHGCTRGQHGWFDIDEMIGWEADLETDLSDHCKAAQMQISSRIKQVEEIQSTRTTADSPVEEMER